MLAGTIRDNLLLSKPEASDAELIEVLRMVNLEEVLQRETRGLDAEVGENGIMLSGGERQRLAIARARKEHAAVCRIGQAPTSALGIELGYELPN